MLVHSSLAVRSVSRTLASGAQSLVRPVFIALQQQHFPSASQPPQHSPEALRRHFSSRPSSRILPNPSGCRWPTRTDSHMLSLGVRAYATRSADEIMEEIQEQYATARDEFEIASEETEKVTVYAEDDRAAAREELEKLKKMYEDAINEAGKEIGDEVTRRVGGRIRELEVAVGNMEELAMHQD